MPKIQSLADYFGTNDPPDSAPASPRLEDITDCKAFALAVLGSREFRSYIVNGLVLGELPPGIVTRLMDLAWGRPAERVEHTGKDGAPIVAEIRRVFVHVAHSEEEDAVDDKKPVTH